MSKKLYFISDIHIGTNEPTNWYQDEVHTPFLEEILSFIRNEQSKNNDVQELVILGDLLDQWMYTPDKRPPNFQDIITANPKLFGGQIDGKKVVGAFPETLDALKGNIMYINGNHDMFITDDDLKTLISPEGYHIQSTNSLFYQPKNCSEQLICTHGHAYSMFNAPNYSDYPPNNPPLPIGFFVSRFAARWSSQHFTAQQPNVAYMKDSGNPNGAIFAEKVLEGIWPQLKEKTAFLSNLLLSALSNATNHVDKGFVMPNGDFILLEDVIQLYKNMYDNYPQNTNIPKSYFPADEAQTRFRALAYTDAMNNLWEFAYFLAKQHQLVIMGHTHVALEKKINLLFSDRIYCNSGFGCPSIPDMNNHKSPVFPTFIEVIVDGNEFTTSLYEVKKLNNEYIIKKVEQATVKKTTKSLA